MKIVISCLDQELLWALDDVRGGLYSIDLETFETKCVIDCQELFPHGKFEVTSLFAWKENYIVIVPLEINKNWIFYNKITGEIEYRNIIEQKYREIMIATDLERNQLYFFPLYKYDPILSVNMDTLTCSQMVENWSSGLPGECLKTASKGTYNRRYVFFTIKNTRFLARMDCERRKVDLLELDIPENVIGVDYAFEELWVLPVRGNRIYQIDENGFIINSVEILAENVEESLPCFARIVVQKKYVFLLPHYRRGIYVYDKQEKITQIVPKENISLKKKDKEIYLRYWEYCVRNNQICFLPYRENYIEIDLDSLAYKEKELSYPDIWSDEEKVWRSIQSHVSEQDFVIRETDGCDLNIFLKYIQCETDTKEFLKHEYVGNRVWDMARARMM